MPNSTRTQTVLVWATIVLLVSASVSVFLADRQAAEHFSTTEEHWENYINRSSAKARHLRDIRTSFGYGGFIHNFKNYVLRRNASLAEKTKSDAARLRAAIEAYEALGTIPEEQDAVNAIRAAVEDYAAKIPVIRKAIARNTSSEEIDRLAKVDDTHALTALTYLETIWFDARNQTSQRLSESIAFGRQAIQRSILIVLLLLPAVLLTIVMLRRLLRQANLRADDLERQVADRRQAEARLRESESQLTAVLENVTEGIVTIDTQGTILTFNRSAQRIFGYPAEDVIGQSVTMLMPQSNRAFHQGHIDKYLKTGDSAIIGSGRELVGRRKDGTEFPVGIGISDLTIDGKRVFIGALSDLTEHKALEQQLLRSQRMQAVGQLTGGIAHDFNNLMGIIIGNAELLEDAIANNGFAEERIHAIKEAIDRGARLTDRLLVFSRKQTFTERQTSISDLIQGLTDMLRRTLGETIVLNTEIQSTVWDVYLDPHQFENALINLAVNARDAMPDGGVLFITANQMTLSNRDIQQLGADEDMPAGDYVHVSVRDTGTGMDEETVARVFEPFFTTKEVGKGSGLGLSMVYGFAKQSKGHATVISQLGRGTTVNLYLPRSSEVDTTRSAEPTPQPLTGGTERILVVEDNPEIREISVSILKSQGYDVSEAENGEEAVDLLDKTSFDLLFTDVVLPRGISGFQVATEALSIQPGIKVLFTTGYAEHPVLQGENSFTDEAVFITKPFQRKDLIQKIRTVLDS